MQTLLNIFQLSYQMSVFCRGLCVKMGHVWVGAEWPVTVPWTKPVSLGTAKTRVVQTVLVGSMLYAESQNTAQFVCALKGTRESRARLVWKHCVHQMKTVSLVNTVVQMELVATPVWNLVSVASMHSARFWEDDRSAPVLRDTRAILLLSASKVNIKMVYFFL